VAGKAAQGRLHAHATPSTSGSGMPWTSRHPVGAGTQSHSVLFILLGSVHFTRFCSFYSVLYNHTRSALYKHTRFCQSSLALPLLSKHSLLFLPFFVLLLIRC
jgi:hypothetical protein